MARRAKAEATVAVRKVASGNTPALGRHARVGGRLLPGLHGLPPLAIDVCGGTINVEKVIDADGNLGTTGDQAVGAGWTFDAVVDAPDSATPSSGDTDVTGIINFDIDPGGMCTGIEIDCEDGGVCTTDSCETDLGCMHMRDPANGPSCGDDHYKCYKTRGMRFARRNVTLKDQFGSTTATVVKPPHFCTPVDKNGEDPTAPLDVGHLTCFKIRQAPGQPHFVPVVANVEDQFVTQGLRSTRRTDCGRSQLLCAPSLKFLTEPPASASAAFLEETGSLLE